MERKMTDKEMLMLAYGALKSSSTGYFKEVVKIVEEHLYPKEEAVNNFVEVQPDKEN